ncbi:MAG TPA: NAD-dependent epimerase/dehydratase family protein [Candidatus Binatia bacterium]|nr:NAD-dependent epimerase/dehydratase family protein [Candidatus Binatia bacterium]
MRPPYQPRRILVTGATGTIGRALWPSLAGFQVPIRALAHRRSVKSALAQPLVEIVPGDLGHPGSLRGVAEGCDVVVHAAARTGFGSAARAAQRRVNVAGTEALLDEAKSSGARLFLFIGYTGTVQECEDPGPPVDEDTPPGGRYESDYVRMKFEAEVLVLEQNRPEGMTTMVVSPGVLAQPGSNTILGGFVRAFLTRELPFRLLSEVWLAVTDGSDVGRCVASAIERGRGGRRYFATGESIRLGELYDLLAELSGVPAPRRRLPDLLAEELGLLTPVLPRQSFLRQLVLPRELVLHLERLSPVRNARTRAELLFDPTPLRSTLAAMIEEEKGRGTRGVAT